MREYLVSVIVMSSLLGLISYLSYPGSSEKSMKFAVAVLLVYTAMTPIATFVSAFSEEEVQDFVQNVRDEINENQYGDKGEYVRVSEEAIKSGISKLIFTEYGIAEENIEVHILGFDFEKMKAKKISVILSGKAALSDYRSIENFVSELGIGKCEVNIEFG